VNLEPHLFARLATRRRHDVFISINSPTRKADLTPVIRQGLGSTREENFGAVRTVGESDQDR
jgi:hypothetical protein